MTVTSPQIILSMGDAVLSAASSSDTHTRADIDDLVNGTASRILKYATFEPDQWLLDGTYKIAPDPASIGFVSDEISLIGSTFTSDPVVTLTLDAAIDIEQGITFEFSQVSGDYCTSVKVDYQNAATASVYSKTYSPDGYNYFAEILEASKPAAAIKYIVITFYETNTAYRHVKLLDVFVDGVMWDRANIKSATIIEEIDLSLATIPGNELRFTLYDPSGGFSIVDPGGIYASLAENQRVDAYEFVDTDRIYMGRFYLKDWDSVSENIASFKCVDALSLLERIEYLGDLFIDTATNVLDTIMADVSFIDHDIEIDLASISIDGWIPITNIREALHQLAFAIEGYVTCSRSKKITIKKADLIDDISVWDYDLSYSDIRKGHKITQRPLVTGIDIISHGFEENQENLTSYSDLVTYVYRNTNIPTGNYVIKHPEYISTYLAYSSTSAITVPPTPSASSANSFTFEVTTSGSINILLYRKYTHSKERYFQGATGLPANVSDNIMIIENTTFINNSNVEDTAQRALDYAAQRYKAEIGLFASSISVGDSAKIDTLSGKELWGVVEKVEIDMVSGFFQKVVAIGEIH